MSPPVTAAIFAPPPHSIAVLPFSNLSGDSAQEYFSEGLTEEVLNSLAQITRLQIAGRTSSFYFNGKDVDLGTIARKLNVADVLEGSVRRSAGTIRVTAQLTNTVTGYEVWSKTYDRNAGDVLKLQTEIATAVADALQVTLLGDVAARIELGGTRNPAAFDTYLRASRAYQLRQGSYAGQHAEKSCLSPRDLYLGATTQLHVQSPIHSKVYAFDVFDIDDLLAVGTKEPLGVQARLEAREWTSQQRVNLVPKEPHVIAFSGEELYIAEGHEPAPITVTQEQPFEDRAAGCRGGRGARRSSLGASHRRGKSLGLDGFQQVVERANLERT